MKTVEEVRRLRLAQLKVEAGTLVALNEKIGLDKRDSTLSQIMNSAKNSKTGKGKEMGSPMARKLEAACGKEVGWMDTDPALESVLALANDINQLPKRQRDLVLMAARNAVDLARETVALRPVLGQSPADLLAHDESDDSDSTLRKDEETMRRVLRESRQIGKDAIPLQKKSSNSQ